MTAVSFPDMYPPSEEGVYTLTAPSRKEGPRRMESVVVKSNETVPFWESSSIEP